MRQLLLLSRDFKMATGSAFRMHDVPEKPHQPRGFLFPKQEFRKNCYSGDVRKDQLKLHLEKCLLIAYPTVSK